MSDQDTTTHEDTIEQLRAKADEAATKDRVIDQKDREIAMLQAGIPTGSKVGKAFMQTYEGELDVEKIRAEAVEFGLWKPEGADAEPEPDPTAHDRELLRSGANVSDQEAPKPHPSVAALERMRDSQKAGLPQEQTRIRAITDMIAAAIDGDQRMLIKQASGMERTAETEHIGHQDGKARSPR